jgi:hypothetical protein
MVTNDLTTTNVSSTLTSSNPALKMYLYACKLLDVLLAMPYSELHHFQLYVHFCFFIDLILTFL